MAELRHWGLVFALVCVVVCVCVHSWLFLQCIYCTILVCPVCGAAMSHCSALPFGAATLPVRPRACSARGQGGLGPCWALLGNVPSQCRAFSVPLGPCRTVRGEVVPCCCAEGFRQRCTIQGDKQCQLCEINRAITKNSTVSASV